MREIRVQVGAETLCGLESSGKGPAIVFCHGNSACAELFAPLLRSSLGGLYRMVALSFCGHGRSPRSTSPDSVYSVPGFASVLVRALRELRLGRFIAVGHSLGGHVLTSALPELEDMLAGLLLVSAPPLELHALAEIFRPDPSQGALFAGSLGDPAVAAFADALIEPGRIPKELRTLLESSIRSTDPEFRVRLGRSIGAGMLLDERALLERSSVKTALVYGTGDRFVFTSAYARARLRNPWETGAIPFEASGHSPHLDHPTAFEALLHRFIVECSDLEGTARSRRSSPRAGAL